MFLALNFLLGCGEAGNGVEPNPKYVVGYTTFDNPVLAMNHQLVNIRIIDLSLQAVSDYWIEYCEGNCDFLLEEITMIRVWASCPLPSLSNFSYSGVSDSKNNGFYFPDDMIIDICVDETFEIKKQLYYLVELTIHEATHHMQEVLGLEHGFKHEEYYWLNENDLVQKVLGEI